MEESDQQDQEAIRIKRAQRMRRNVEEARQRLAANEQTKRLKLLMILTTIVIILLGSRCALRPAPPTDAAAEHDNEPSQASAPYAACDTAIEGMLRYRHNWTSSFLTRWNDPMDGAYIDTLTMHGNALEVENEYGAMQRVQYFCTYDATTGRALTVGIPTLSLRREL